LRVRPASAELADLLVDAEGWELVSAASERDTSGYLA
jgi:hypothetical protein